MKTITQEYAKECLHYDPMTGVFMRRIRPRSHFPDQRSMTINNKNYGGKEAGTVSKHGYRVIYIEGMLLKAHRLAFLYMTGSFPSGVVDHINQDKMDNRWQNLRDVSSQENAKNMPMLKNNTSGVHGVSWDSYCRRWKAEISANKKSIYLGKYIDIWEAICARKSAEKTYGFHENHGRSPKLQA